jgi:superfamily II DNA or RNA helicase
MKEPALKLTESCQVIIATYAMAAEALDIKSLTTLIMATPKTDITQAVGRILRIKHERPLIIDIIDSHDIFKRQWAKRKKFYKTQNYMVTQMTSDKYCTSTSNTNGKITSLTTNDDGDDDGDESECADEGDLDEDQPQKKKTNVAVTGCLLDWLKV